VLAFRSPPVPAGSQPPCALEKVGRWDLEDLADLLEPAGADPVRALFVFLDLLECKVDVTAKGLL
jgi:hypothetical protein